MQSLFLADLALKTGLFSELSMAQHIIDAALNGQQKLSNQLHISPRRPLSTAGYKHICVP